MYRYADLEAVLMRLHSVPAFYRAAFSARLKYFRRIGVSGKAPGKGTRIDYELKDIWLFAVCMELAQFGVDPSRIALMMSNWLGLVIKYALPDVKKTKEHLFFAARPVFLSREGIENHEKSGTTGQGLMPIVDPYDPQQSYILKASELAEYHPARALLLDLTDLLARIEEALVHTSTQAEA